MMTDALTADDSTEAKIADLYAGTPGTEVEIVAETGTVKATVTGFDIVDLDDEDNVVRRVVQLELDDGREAKVTIDDDGYGRFSPTLEYETSEGWKTHTTCEIINDIRRLSDDGQSDEEIVADGGEDVTDIVTDGEIEERIEQHDDPDHEDAYTVEEIRDTLAAINADILDYWDEHQDAIDEGGYHIVHEDRDVIVLADSGHFWSTQFNAMGIGDEHGILSSIIISLHHTAARKRCDYSWSASTPVVVRKTEEFRVGEQQVLREIARRTDELGSVARAVDTLATETHGWSKSDWARLTGRNPSTVTRMTDNSEGGSQ